MTALLATRGDFLVLSKALGLVCPIIVVVLGYCIVALQLLFLDLVAKKFSAWEPTLED